MVGTLASLVLTSMAGRGFVTPRHAVSATGLVWPMNDLFHDPLRVSHPAGMNVMAVAGNAQTTAILYSHDRNVEIMTIGTGGPSGTNFNQTDAPREMSTAGSLKMWSLENGRFFVQSESRLQAWIFDPVKYWSVATYLPGLAGWTSYGNGVIRLGKAKLAPQITNPTSPGTDASAAKPKASGEKPKEEKVRRVARFVYLPLSNEGDLEGFAGTPETDDQTIEVALPEGSSPVTGFVPIATEGFVAFQAGKKILLVSLAEKAVVAETESAPASGSTLAVEAGQMYAISFGPGGRPQVKRLATSAVKAEVEPATAGGKGG